MPFANYRPKSHWQLRLAVVANDLRLARRHPSPSPDDCAALAKYVD